MFSKELEDLIQATLEDGKLEENEKAALVKRAQREGVDLDELEIYINSLLQRRQRELNEKRDQREEEYAKKKKEAIGPVCPKCGKQVPPLTLKCDCGYEFKKEKKESSVKLLYDRISNLQLTDEEIDSCSDVAEEKVNNEYRAVRDRYGNVVKKLDEDKANKLKLQKKIDIIQSFPVPNTKEDIMEFLALAVPNSKTKGGLWGTITGRIKILSILAVISFVLCLIFVDDGHGHDGALLGGFVVFGIAVYGGMVCFDADQESIRYNKLANAWHSKFDQVLMKGRSLRADPEFSQMLDYYENQMKLNEIESKKIFGIKLLG